MPHQDENSRALSEDEAASVTGGAMSEAERDYVKQFPPTQQGLARIQYQERMKALGSAVLCPIPVPASGEQPLKPKGE